MARPVFQLKGEVAMPPGYLQGMHHPVLVAQVAISSSEDVASRLEAREAELESLIPDAGTPPARRPQAGQNVRFAQRIVYWVARLQAEARWALREVGRVAAPRESTDAVLLFVPTLPMSQPATLAALQWVVAAFSAAAAGRPLPLVRLERVRKDLAWHAGTSSNMPRFLRAANELALPWDRLTRQVYSFGQGMRTRWLDSSYTDETPFLSSRIARDKVQCASVLRRAGLPAPVHALVDDADHAVREAAALGYPVVVKPANLDGGVGVAADLRTEDEVRRAYAVARAASSQVLVEKHFEGKDYRLTVFRGKLLWANERQPGGVTGDGRSTIGELVDIANTDPNRGDSPLAALKKLVLDEEADTALGRQGLTRASVPEAGRFVRLRLASNTVRGGIPLAVLDQVHPDNAALAVRAARLLRLDLAGIDLLIPNVRRSWLESGALICEVNAQPSIGQFTAAHLYKPLLQALVPGNGRIPIALVVGAAEPEALGAHLVERLATHDCMAGWAGPQGGALGGERLANQPMPLYDRGRMLLMDTRAQAAVAFADAAEVLRQGLPFARFDVLLWAGREAPHAALATCLAACDGVVGVLAGLPALPAAGRQVHGVPATEAGAWLVKELLAARTRHA